MMSKLNYVMLHASYEEELAAYSDQQVGRMLRGLLHLLNTGEEYIPKGSERYIWPTLRGQFQRNLDTYDKKCQVNREASQKGVAARKKKYSEAEEPNATERLPNGYKEKEKEKENEKENEKDKEKERETETGVPPPVFSPPDLNSVLAYCQNQKLEHVDPTQFYDHYSSIGWRVGSNPVQDWQALLRRWNSQDAKKQTKEEQHHETYQTASKFGILL